MYTLKIFQKNFLYNFLRNAIVLIFFFVYTIKESIYELTECT